MEDGLARGPNDHLNFQEIERLLPPGVSYPPRETDVPLDEARLHVKQCEACRRRLDSHAGVDRILASLRSSSVAARGMECPAEEIWMNVALGMANEEDADSALSHASQCDYCGPILRRVAEDFSEQNSLEEDSILANINSARTDWQYDLAARLAGESNRSQAFPSRNSREKSDQSRASGRLRFFPTFSRVWGFAFSFGLIVALIIIFGWWTWSWHNNTERLLAKAYSEQRTMEMRIPGASYAPLRVERGPIQSLPPELHEAIAMILRSLRRNPNDPRLLDQEGRAQLLQGDFEGAIQSLERARRADPKSAAILTDLASAYFQRARSGGPASDYGKSIELLEEALSRDPNNPVALFNRAVANEKIPANQQQALEDWNRYLRVDSKSGWSNEARKHLKDLRNSHSGSLTRQVPAGPLALASMFQKRLDQRALKNPVEASLQDEDLLAIALTDWLPARFDLSPLHGGSIESQNFGTALRIFAEVLERRHNDYWLRDLLESRISPDFSAGILALSHAVKANIAGDASTGQTQSERAAAFFQTAGSTPGLLRARMEYVYSLQRSLRAKECLAAVEAIKKSVQESGYTLLEVQLLLEESACDNLIGRVGLQEGPLARALAISQANSYETLYLRALGFSAGMDRAKGNLDKSWTEDIAGLQQYTSGNYSPLRGYQFFSDLALSAEESGEWYLAADLWRSATSIVSISDNRALEAQAYYYLASDENMSGDQNSATSDFTRSGEFYASLPASDAKRAYIMNGEIAVASLEADRGQFDSALLRLENVRPSLPLVSDYEIPLHFYLTMGKIRFRSGEVAEAERALRAAIAISESGLSSLRGDADRLVWERQTGEAYRILVELKLKDENDPVTALELWEWYEGAALRIHDAPPKLDFSALEAGPPLPALAKIADSPLYSTNYALLVYVQLPDTIAIWQLNNHKLNSKWLAPPVSNVGALAQRFAEECSDRSSSETLLKSDAQQLYHLLIAPVASTLRKGQTLAIEADGVLSQVPFQALVDDSDRYLGEEHPVTTFPGLAFLSIRGDPIRFVASDKVLVVGAPTLGPDFGSEYPPLPDVEREIDDAVAHFPGARVLSGAQATLDQVKSALQGVKIFHFAGHSFSIADRGGLLLAPPSSSTFVRQRPEILYSSDLNLETLKMCRLAILSACSTALGNNGPVANPEGLVRAFLRAGVSYVIASRWDVDSQATSLFMDRFYTALLSGATVERAIQSAETALRLSEGMSHPYFWAAFTSFGVS